jgi:hypothetical protein
MVFSLYFNSSSDDKTHIKNNGKRKKKGGFALRILPFISAILLSLSLLGPLSRVYAKTPQTLLQCLGQEELKLHKMKITGPVYKLNQLFISELSTYDGIKVKKEHLRSICNYQNFSPSVKLLKYLLTYGHAIFDKKSEQVVTAVSEFNNVNLDNFIENVPKIFFSYLAHVQSLSPGHSCLYEKLPHLRYFLNRYKYLEGAIPISHLMKEKKKISEIFRRLSRLDNIIRRCEKEVRNKVRKNKSSKKAKSKKR